MVHFIPTEQRRLTLMAAQTDSAPVLIHGGSGSGKSAIAKWIHNNSARSGRPLLIATRDFPLSEQLVRAQGGTLVIPEIGSWPLAEQKTLLNFINTRSVPHPQSSHETSGTPMRMLLNVRVMATSSYSLEGRSQGGLFNPDLLDKLNVFRIEMPPLSSRQDEFEDIVMGILGEITRELHREHIRGFSPDTWLRLKTYAWPGNLRELRNVLKMSILKTQSDQIQIADLPDFGQHRTDFRSTREEFERFYIQELLKTYDWQIEKTCEMSRIDRTTLLGKMKKYGISSHPSNSNHPPMTSL